MSHKSEVSTRTIFLCKECELMVDGTLYDLLNFQEHVKIDVDGNFQRCFEKDDFDSGYIMFCEVGLYVMENK